MPTVVRSAAVAAGVVLLLDTLRVWLPSVIFVYGRAGTTPATEMGAFALLPFALAFLGAAAVRVLPPARVAAVAATGVVVLRFGLQLTAGGDPQLWVSTAGMVAGLVWLVALAGAAVGRSAALGLAAGLAADATLHALLRSTGLAWRDGPGPWLVLVVVAVLLLVGAWTRAPADERVPDPEEPSAAPGIARAWLAFGPLLVLHGIRGGVVSHLHAVTGWAEPVAVLVVVGAHTAAVAAAWGVVAGGYGRSAARVGAVVVLAGLGAMLTVPAVPGEVVALSAALVAVGHILLPLGGAVTLAALLSSPGAASPARRGLACAAGLLVFLALTFGYYAGYDLVLPFENHLLLWVAGLLVALVAALAAPAPPRRSAVRRRAAHGVIAAAGVAVLAAGSVAVAADAAVPAAGDGLPARVMTYNLQMGFDIAGRHSVERLGAVIAAEEPVVVGVQEVSRGWLINSATDVLPRLAEQLGMVYAFTPAADAVWGNAILSRHPLWVVEEVALPRGEAPMPRSAQAVVVDLGEGVELGVVNTHLTHRAEDAALRAQQLAIVDDMARRLAATGRPVVLLGDLNAEPGSPELAPLEAWLDHAWEEEPAGTWPSWGPFELIDHILLTDDLVARDYRVGTSTASDHLPAAATLDAAR